MSSSNVSAVTNHFPTANEGFTTTTSGSILSGAVTVPLNSVSGLTNGTIFVGIIEPGQVKEQTFTGTVDTAGTQITGVKWTRGSNVDHSAGVTVVDYVSGTGNNMHTKGILVEHNQDGTHDEALITSRTADTAPASGDSVLTYDTSATALKKVTLADLFKTPPVTSGTMSATDWKEGVLPAVSSVTNYGNGSEDVVFASTVASLLSPGMRVQVTKTVAGNGYMGGAFNGSTHYFTKATPSGTLGTVANNFTIETTYEPTSYTAGWICGRADATPNNGFGIQMNSSGQVVFAMYSGGAANFRSYTTYQSLPLNKKTRIAVSYTSTGPACTIYFNDVSVPVGAASTGGTAPTTAGTGGDWSIGRLGAYVTSPVTGYVSNTAVFDAVLTAATIRSHGTYKLLGSETNCIGAWSLDNTANDQSSAANNLTATGGVGYTARSPHGTLGSGIDTLKAVGLVMAVSTTTATVQVPEGCTIPTSGGVSAVAYSTTANPYGWVADKGRWEVGTLLRINTTQASPVTNTWYNMTSTTGVSGGTYLTVPVGNWQLTYTAYLTGDRAAASAVNFQNTLSTSSSTESDMDYTMEVSGNNVLASGGQTSEEKRVSVTTATPYYLNTRSITAGPTNVYLIGSRSSTRIYAIPAGV